MYLFFDTETTGTPKNYKAPMSDVDNWPHCAQIAWQLYDKDGLLIMEQSEMIFPDGWEIPKEKFFIDNNMSTERCRMEGLPIKSVLSRFLYDLNQCEYMIAHNFAFDYPILGAEMIRSGMRAERKIKGICTMNQTTEFCKLPGKFAGKYKWPKLSELYEKIFDKSFDEGHDALFDVRATAECFFELVKRGVIKL